MLSSFVSYAIEKRISRRPEQLGRGAIEGVAGPEAANNAATFGSMVPLLTLGIPSNVVMAVFLAALMVHGTTPGPLPIQNQPDFFWGVMISMIVGNIMLLILNLPLIGMWVKILKVPYKVLFPLIILFCLIGSYSVNLRVIDMILMLIFGVVGYFMRKFEYDGGPFILPSILGPLLETAPRQSLIISHGELPIFVSRPLAPAALLIALLFLLKPPEK